MRTCHDLSIVLFTIIFLFLLTNVFSQNQKDVQNYLSRLKQQHVARMQMKQKQKEQNDGSFTVVQPIASRVIQQYVGTGFISPPPVPDTTNSGAKRAIVTMLCGGSDSLNTKYAKFLHTFAFTLRQTNYTGELLLLFTKEFPLAKVAHTIAQFKINTQLVTQITIPNKNHRYAHMLTKLHIWNLIQYEQIIYYDVDFLFQKNPEIAYQECDKNVPLCAVQDQGYPTTVTTPNGSKEYFNAGFMIIQPNLFTYQRLIALQNTSFSMTFVEQDLLNKFFQDNWKPLPVDYNLMHTYRLPSIGKDTIAIHEKLSELQKNFPDKNYLWNHLFR